MWKQIRRSVAAGVWACSWMAAASATTAASAVPAAAVTVKPRLEVLVRTELPQAQQALKRHQRHCDTLLAVMHARRAMAFSEGYNDASTWQDMELLVAQCQVKAQQMREQLSALEAEHQQLRQREQEAKSAADKAAAPRPAPTHVPAPPLPSPAR